MQFDNLPTPQGAKSDTFAPPPFRDGFTVPECWDFHFQKSPNHPLFIYESGPSETKEVLWREGVPAIHRAARVVQSHVETHTRVVNDKPAVVGILAIAGMFRI